MPCGVWSSDGRIEAGFAMADASSPDEHLRAGGGAASLGRLALVGAIVAGVGVAFAYTGGWLTPRALTPERFIDTFEQVNGPHPGFRRNHAKGVCASGVFESNGGGARLSRAVVFRPGRVAVVGRLALAGGNTYKADAVQTVRSLALRYSLPNGEEWRSGMNSIPVFAVRTPEAFRDQLVATSPDPTTGKPDPTRMQAFVRRPSGIRPRARGYQGRADRVRLREQHLQQPQRLRAGRCGRQLDAGPLGDGPAPAVRRSRDGAVGG